MHLAAGLFDLGRPGLEVEIQIGQRVVFDVAADVAELLEFGKPGDSGGAAAGKGRAGGGQGFLQPGIGELLAFSLPLWYYII